jgi:hypothetical protein
MRASEFIIERKKRSKKTRGLGGYFFPGYGFYGGDSGEGGGDGGGGGESKQGMLEAMVADQVLDYVNRLHHDFDIEYSITDHPEWELKNIPLRQLHLDPDGEEQDPYNRVNWVDYDKVRDLIPKIGSVLKSSPIVVDSQGWIIDGNHRAMAAAEAGLTSVPALVPVNQKVAEGTEQKPVVIYTNHRGATIDDDIKKSLRTTQEPFNKLQMWEKHKSMKDPKIADWVTNKLLPELKQNGVLKPLLVWNNNGQLFVIDGNHRFLAYQEAGFRGRVPVQIVPDNMIIVSDTVPGQQGVAEGESNDTAISLSKLGKFHPGADTLAQFVPERATAQYALHPDKWESTFYSLTNKDSDKLKYYGPKKISIPPGTLVGDMAIANKFYRAKTSEEKQQYAELYKASLQPYPVDVSEYRMPELLIPKQGVAENFADGKNPGRKGLAKRSGVNTKASVSSLRKTAKNSSGEKQRMAHWLANMKAGRAKAKK